MRRSRTRGTATAPEGSVEDGHRAVAAAVAAAGFGALVAALLAGCATPGAAGGACTMQEISELPVLTAHGSPVVAGAVNGKAVAFLVDTGSAISTIDPDQAAPLGLAPSGSNHFAITGVGGDVMAPVLPVHDLRFGSALAHDVDFAETGHVEGRVAGLRLVGLFGADFLSNYDVEFDLPARRIGLYVEQGRCGTDFTPWDGPAIPVRYRLDPSGHVLLTIRLDGAPVDAFLDSGASHSLVDRPDARAAGVTATALAKDRIVDMRGIADVAEQARVHRFAAIEVGGDRSGPMTIAVGDTPETLLGADWLRHHRVWISYPHDQVLFQDAAPPAGLPAGSS